MESFAFLHDKHIWLQLSSAEESRSQMRKIYLVVNNFYVHGVRYLVRQCDTQGNKLYPILRKVSEFGSIDGH